MKTNKAALAAVLEETKTILLSGYSAESLTALMTVKKTAAAVLADQTASQPQIDEARLALLLALVALISNSQNTTDERLSLQYAIAEKRPSTFSI